MNGFENQRESFSIPGASDLDYKFAIIIDTINISKWISGMTEVEVSAIDNQWANEIIKERKQNWEFFSKPKYFIRKGENVNIILYKNEGILFKRVTNY